MHVRERSRGRLAVRRTGYLFPLPDADKGSGPRSGEEDAGREGQGLIYADDAGDRAAPGVAIAENGTITVTPSVLRELQERVSRLEAEEDSTPERVVTLSSRSVVVSIGIILFTVAVVGLVLLAWGAITLVLIALLAALGLNPAVEFFVARGLRRGWATSPSSCSPCWRWGCSD